MRNSVKALIAILVATASLPALAQMPPPRGAAAPSGEGGPIAGRLDRLEEQVVNLQGVISAVETLAKTNAGHSSGYATAGGGASGEQVRQLSEQIADLTQRLERLEGRLGAGGPAAPQREGAGYGAVTPPGGFEDKQQLPPLGAAEPQRQAGLAPAQRPFGTDAMPAPAPRSPSPAIPAVAPGPAAGGVRALYDQGVAALNQREYAAAETYLQQFLDQYPNDVLAGNAQFWLGETAFVSGEYRSAADRFLKTFTNYPSSDKAPEALLKLAISLRRLGENSAACDSFAELSRRFPQSPKTIQQRAETEKKRANCT